jgi:hypothetical protein
LEDLAARQAAVWAEVGPRLVGGIDVAARRARERAEVAAMPPWDAAAERVRCALDWLTVGLLVDPAVNEAAARHFTRGGRA